jgi:hypothetical protein
VSPREEVEALYRREPCARTFEQDLALHHQFGVVFDQPDYFVMGRPVRKDADPALIVNPAYVFLHQVCDCWMVYAFAGDLSKAWEVLPFHLKWFAFERKNELRIYEAADIYRLSRRAHA